MNRIKKFVRDHSVSLFKVSLLNDSLAIFDNRGFEFSMQASTLYSQIKSQPHLYVAFGNGFYYIGKSFQSNGRWRKGHYYHLGTLAHEILNTIKIGEQRHDHWVNAWMLRNTAVLTQIPYRIQLRNDVRIAFIPFELYSEGLKFENLEKSVVIRINKEKETELIQSYLDDGFQLLNIQNNR